MRMLCIYNHPTFGFPTTTPVDVEPCPDGKSSASHWKKVIDNLRRDDPDLESSDVIILRLGRDDE